MNHHDYINLALILTSLYFCLRTTMELRKIRKIIKDNEKL